MGCRLKVNDEMEIGIDGGNGRTCITVYDCVNGSTVLSDLETSEYFTSDVKFNEYYIVAYSKGCMANQIPLNIDGAYSIKDKRKLELSNKLKELLENMLVCCKNFCLTHVLTAINYQDLQLLDVEDADILMNYLSAKNPNISKSEVVDYILQCYPSLKPYANLEGPISVERYKAIEKELGKTSCFFHSMSQDLLKLPGITG